ncbi:MAG: hypothetical protein ACK44D_07155, partial [Bacteroidia bacterium]
MKKIFTTIMLLVSISFVAQSQEKSAKEIRGDKYVFNYSYNKAIRMYNKVTPLSIGAMRNLAKSYSSLDSNVQAEAT